MRQTSEQSLFERVAGETLVEVLDLSDDHVTDRRVVHRRFRVDHVLGLTVAVHVQLKQ